MSQPPTIPDPGPARPTPAETAPSWRVPEAAWPAPAAQPVPDWAMSTPAWQPAGPAAPQAVPAPAAAGRARWAVAGAALVGVVTGAVAATVLVAAVFVGSAEDIGRSMAEELVPGLTEGIRDGMVEGAEQQWGAATGMLDEEVGGGWYGSMPGGAVQQFPPVEPTDLGPDETLDAYAQGCFDGDLQNCDDLMYESPPLSDYEEYGSTCGGRVKAFTVMACTELE